MWGGVLFFGVSAQSAFSTVCPDLCVWFAVGAPSPAGHLGTAGVRGEEGQHGDSRARSREQHLVLRIAVPWRIQDAKAAHSHTA